MEFELLVAKGRETAWVRPIKDPAKRREDTIVTRVTDPVLEFVHCIDVQNLERYNMSCCWSMKSC